MAAPRVVPAAPRMVQPVAVQHVWQMAPVRSFASEVSIMTAAIWAADLPAPIHPSTYTNRTTLAQRDEHRTSATRNSSMPPM